VEGLDAFEEEETACKRPDICRAHDVSWGADDLWRSVCCSPPDARVPGVEVSQLDLHPVLLPGEQDVGGAQVAVVHVVCVQVVDALGDGERDVHLDMKRKRLAPGPVVLQRHAHAFHAYDAALDAGDEHQMRMFGNVQQVCRRLHCSRRTATLWRAHRDVVCHEKHDGLAALEAGLHFGCLHAGPGFYPLLKNTKKRADLEFEIFFLKMHFWIFFLDFFGFFFDFFLIFFDFFSK
jgi:hypothetical protein